MELLKICVFLLTIFTLFAGCAKDNESPAGNNDKDILNLYPGVPKSDIYEISVIRGEKKEKLVVFINECPQYEFGKMNMESKDRYPLELLAGRSISWTKFSFTGTVQVEVRVKEQAKVPLVGDIRVLPSRHGVTAIIEGSTVRFTLTNPGQYSLEIGNTGYRNGLMIFADPTETDKPGSFSRDYYMFQNATKLNINTVPLQYSGIYFKSGMHDIGVFRIPANIKNIYFEDGSWVYGALILDANPDVKIFGRGVLSCARLNYRESHAIEAINQSNNIHIEGIVIEDPKYFAIRLIGQNNTIKWTKSIGGWVYNLDGFTAFAGSNVSNCFIWANDDAIKIYRSNITWTDIVVWLLDNGGIIQMSWGGSNALNVTLRRIDILRAGWNPNGFNRASLISCVGNRERVDGRYGIQQDWLIEDVITENPVPVIFNISPHAYTPNHIHNLTMKNWKVSMPMNTDDRNIIIGNDPDRHINGFVFDNFIFNDTRLTSENWIDALNIHTERFDAPTFR